MKGKWYHRRQAVKELHSTLIRLLNELLPWEPKLMKAFQRNRSRLKKDYDDFRRQPDHDKFTRELWTTEEGEGDLGKESPKVEISKSVDSTEHLDTLEKDRFDSDDMKLSEIDLPVARSKLLKKELPSKDIPKTLPKTLKRQSRQSSHLDDSTKQLSPRKKAKLSTSEPTVETSEDEMQIDCLNESKHTEPPCSESFASVDSVPTSALQKGTKPIQALLAKNTGNKVTLTNQLPSSTGKSAPGMERPGVAPAEASPIKPALTCHSSTKGPLQMVYKMPCGQWLPVDLQNSSVKIQMQPTVDPKTGEKITQQVIILPKNFVIQHKDGKAVAKEIAPPQQKGVEQHGLSVPQTTNVSSSVLVNSTETVPSQLLNTVFNKTVTPLTHVSSARPQPLSPVTSVNNLLTPSVKNTQSEAATLPQPIAPPTISSTVQPLLSAATLSGSVNPSSSLNSFAQQTGDFSEAKQELKTVCIRDSQSILVRTRGGNTGVVKVQTNPDQNSPSSLSSSSVFTFAPQLQAFLVPKSTTSTSSAFSVAGMTTTSNLPPFSQTTTSSVSNSASCNSSVRKSLKVSSSSNLSHVIDKTSQIPSSPLKSSTVSSTLPPSTTNNSLSVISISTGNFGQASTNVIHPPTKPQQVDFITKSYPVTRSEAMAETNGDMLSGTPVQKLMLVSAPSVLSSGSGTAINVTPAPTSTGVSTQKLVFINAPVPGGTSTPNVATDSLKQTLPSTLNKTYVKTPEQAQIVLIPSTVGTPIKINPSPTVSQIKDVKIGLNIGQAIVNTSSSVPAIPAINILQSITPKEDKSGKDRVLPLSSSSNSIPISSNFVKRNITPVTESAVSTARSVNMFSVAGANVSLGSLSVTSTSASFGTRPPILVSGNDTSSRIMPVLSNRLCTSSFGNTVAISTVKTGHLASSVLISSTQPTVSPKCLTSALQIPVTIALPTPVTAAPKIINTVPHSTTVHGATRSVSLSKRQSRTNLQFQSPGTSTTVPTNVNTNKPHTELSSLSQSPSKVINVSNLASPPNQPVSPAIVKSSPSQSSAPSSSVIHTATAPPNVPSLVGAHVSSEPCIQQKIVINTNTPLAPGTQIMINGTRFIVPPQGLGVGSHILLISTNAKYGPPLVLNSGQGIQPVQVDNPALKTTLPSNNFSEQPVKHPLRSSTKIVNSFGNTTSLPTVHTTPQIVNTTTKLSVPPPATTVSLTSVIKSSPTTILAKTSLVPAISSNTPLPNNTSVFHLDTSVKKLLVSPEGAILNTINTPASKVSSLSSSLSQIVSATRNPASVFPAFQSPGLEKPDTAAS